MTRFLSFCPVFMASLSLTACGGLDPFDPADFSDASVSTLALALEVHATQSRRAPAEGRFEARVSGTRSGRARPGCPAVLPPTCIRPGRDGRIDVPGLCDGDWRFDVELFDDDDDRRRGRCSPEGDSSHRCSPGERSVYELHLERGRNHARFRCEVKPASVSFVVTLQ